MGKQTIQAVPTSFHFNLTQKKYTFHFKDFLKRGNDSLTFYDLERFPHMD